MDRIINGYWIFSFQNAAFTNFIVNFVGFELLEVRQGFDQSLKHN